MPLFSCPSSPPTPDSIPLISAPKSHTPTPQIVDMDAIAPRLPEELFLLVLAFVDTKTLITTIPAVSGRGGWAGGW